MLQSFALYEKGGDAAETPHRKKDNLIFRAIYEMNIHRNMFGHAKNLTRHTIVWLFVTQLNKKQTFEVEINTTGNEIGFKNPSKSVEASAPRRLECQQIPGFDGKSPSFCTQERAFFVLILVG